MPLFPSSLAVLGAALLGLTGGPTGDASASGDPGLPVSFGLYYSAPPCAEMPVDRTYSQFQVNLEREGTLLEGVLRAGSGGRSLLLGDNARTVELLTNASRADWLLSYPFLGEGAGVWGRPILGPDCAVSRTTVYADAVFPAILFRTGIDPRLDLMRRPEAAGLQDAVRGYRRALSEGVEPGDEIEGPAGRKWGAAARLEKELFEPDAARGLLPWRVVLAGSEARGEDEDMGDPGTIDILVSGADGSTGMFGHIAVGSGGMVYNVYPKGSEHGAPELVPVADYLFNAQRGQVIRRPTWLLRLRGLTRKVMAAFDADMRAQIRDIQAGRSLYHPTANNCTIASFRGLNHLGIEVARARYFTHRFPRPAFAHILARLPRLIAPGDLKVRRVELVYVPQVPHRPSVGGPPNRPLRDRSRLN
jgi:hypothetical protein